MTFNQIFTFEIVLAVLLFLGAIVGGLYLLFRNPRDSSRAESAGGLSGSSEQRAQRNPREFYKRMNLETDEDMKMRLFSMDEYRGELGGDPKSYGGGRFVGALKAYRPVGDEWYDFPPDRAANVLSMKPGEYEVDGEHGVLLLRRLPHGLPEEARDVL